MVLYYTLLLGGVMRITKWTEYAVVMLQRLANSGSFAPMSMSTLAEADKLPQDFAEQVMLKLRRNGIVRSTRGARGGYVLDMLPSTISMLQVFDAVEPDSVLVNGSTCEGVKSMLKLLQYNIRDTLSGMTLESTMPNR